MPIMLVCQYTPCSVSFSVKASLKGSQRFCSSKCMGLAKKQPEETRNCAYCGNPFPLRKRTYDRKHRMYCSIQCFWRSKGAEKVQKALDRFWERMERCKHEGGAPCLYCCWLWKDATNSGGYGKLSYKGKDVLAHRRAWEIHNGREMPPELDAAHWCHVRLCSNPTHIRPATPKENTADSIRDGRHIFGSRSGMSKLVEADIPEIFRLHDIGWTKKRIAAYYNVHPTTIRFILTRSIWKHVKIDGNLLNYMRRGKRLHADTPIVMQAYAMRKERKPVWQICEALYITEPTLYRYLHIAQQEPPKTQIKATIVKSKAVPIEHINRIAIYERDRGICHICHRKVSIHKFTLDHLIPRSDGGHDIAQNVAIAHSRCNTSRFTGHKIFAQLRLF